MSERRKVIGRSRTFDELLDEHKKKKKMRKLEKLKSDADMYLNQQSSTSHSPPLRYSKTTPCAVWCLFRIVGNINLR